MSKRDGLRIAGAVLTGLMLAVSFPGWGQSTVVFTALVPLLLAVQSVSSKRAAGLAWLSGMVFFGLSLSWFWKMTHTVDVWLFKVGTLGGFLILIGYCALYFIPFALAACWCGRLWGKGSLLQNLRVMLLLTGVWCGSEFLRGILFSGFGWNALGISQYANPATIQLAERGGVLAVSAVIVWMNAGVFLTVRQYVQGGQLRKYRPHFELMLGLVPLALSVMFGMRVLFSPLPMGEPLQVGLIQPNIPQTARRDAAMNREIRERLESLSSAALRMDEIALLVWPETAVPDYVRLSFPSRALVNRLTREGVPLLVGSMDYGDVDGERRLYNSSLLFEGGKEPVASYHKRHLVPFGEYVPLPGLLRFLSPLDVDFSAGDSATVFEMEGAAPFGVLICFEDTMGWLARDVVRGGARWLVNQTNDAWFDPSAQSEQHLAHAVFRCVENRVPMVRSCNTGVTAIIDAYGRVERRLEPRQGGFLVGAVRPALAVRAPTVYTVSGERFAQVVLAGGVLSFLLLGVALRRHAR
mgnify:CR=1 FL=1